MPRRAINFSATGSNEDPYISDENLGPGWFSANNYRMSDSSNMPTITHCGTEIPIYIKGKHSTKEQMVDGVQINVTTCEKFPWDDCQNERTIYVILCNRIFHYFLQQTSVNAGYCFDLLDAHDDHQNVTASSTTLNESSTGLLAEGKTFASVGVIVGAVVGAVAGFVIVIAVIIATCILVQRRPITSTQSRNEEHRTDNNHYHTSERSTTNDGNVYYYDSNDYEMATPIPAETHVYDQLHVSRTNLEHLASDETD